MKILLLAMQSVLVILLLSCGPERKSELAPAEKELLLETYKTNVEKIDRFYRDHGFPELGSLADPTFDQSSNSAYQCREGIFLTEQAYIRILAPSNQLVYFSNLRAKEKTGDHKAVRTLRPEETRNLAEEFLNLITENSPEDLKKAVSELRWLHAERDPAKPEESTEYFARYASNSAIFNADFARIIVSDRWGPIKASLILPLRYSSENVKSASITREEAIAIGKKTMESVLADDFSRGDVRVMHGAVPELRMINPNITTFGNWRFEGDLDARLAWFIVYDTVTEHKNPGKDNLLTSKTFEISIDAYTGKVIGFRQ